MQHGRGLLPGFVAKKREMIEGWLGFEKSALILSWIESSSSA